MSSCSEQPDQLLADASRAAERGRQGNREQQQHVHTATVTVAACTRAAAAQRAALRLQRSAAETSHGSRFGKKYGCWASLRDRFEKHKNVLR